MILGVMTMSELVEAISEEYHEGLLHCMATREVAIFDETGFWTKPWNPDVSGYITEEEAKSSEWVFLLLVMANGDIQKAKLRPAMLSKGGDA